MNCGMHQIELAQQNEELRETQLKLEESRAQYVDLYDHAPVCYFTFDGKGRILAVNLTVSWGLKKTPCSKNLLLPLCARMTVICFTCMPFAYSI